MTQCARYDSGAPRCPTFVGSLMTACQLPISPFLVVVALGISITGASAQAPAPSEAAQAMVGAWEISNAARDKTCPVVFTLDAGEGGFKVELDPVCRTAFASMKDV